MKHSRTLTMIVVLIAMAAVVCACGGIFSEGGPGPYDHRSIHGQEVHIWGRGLYRDMSAEVAPQGVAQDYVTLFIVLPALLLSLYHARKGSVRAATVLTGILGYFMVTYIFYLAMGMYNAFFLLYVLLAGLGFYGFILAFMNVRKPGGPDSITSIRFGAWLLIIESSVIALLWLSVVVPPLLDGTVIPAQVEHYTTLIVQGFDLAILLPAAFLSGVLLLRKNPWGMLLAPVYLVFLSLLMTALTAKVIAMAILGANVVPVIFIIPLMNLLTVLAAFSILQIKTATDDIAHA
ncbi:MAG: hypothetical protein EOP49_21110 [Sphingobacteriales bacterium]|nr:MAG: hypothetical protein EOP49_21110 [Sphingobacteriales bacterium]